MECGDEIPASQLAVICPEGELIPTAVPALPNTDLRALAAQLPDLAKMDNFTVNIQAISNTFLPPPHNDMQIQALAQDTEARLGGLRQEIQQTLAQGNNALSGRFQLIHRWCKEVFNC